MEPGSSVPYSQQPAKYLHPGPEEPSLHAPFPFAGVKNCTSEKVQYPHYDVIKICGMYSERLSIR